MANSEEHLGYFDPPNDGGDLNPAIITLPRPFEMAINSFPSLSAASDWSSLDYLSYHPQQLPYLYSTDPSMSLRCPSFEPIDLQYETDAGISCGSWSPLSTSTYYSWDSSEYLPIQSSIDTYPFVERQEHCSVDASYLLSQTEVSLASNQQANLAIRNNNNRHVL